MVKSKGLKYFFLLAKSFHNFFVNTLGPKLKDISDPYYGRRGKTSMKITCLINCPFNPLTYGQGRCTPLVVFCPLLKISLGNPNLKILDLSKLFVADATMEKI